MGLTFVTREGDLRIVRKRNHGEVPPHRETSRRSGGLRGTFRLFLRRWFSTLAGLGGF